jgi:hypothetical protein
MARVARLAALVSSRLEVQARVTLAAVQPAVAPPAGLVELVRATPQAQDLASRAVLFR